LLPRSELGEGVNPQVHDVTCPVTLRLCICSKMIDEFASITSW
jgi:hypothetical protein